MKRPAISFLLAMAWLLAAPASAQPDLSRKALDTVADTGAPGYRFEQFRFVSADGQRHYRVRVAVPLAAAPAQGFPAAFLLDGNAALMETDAALLGELAKAPRPPLIAFIGYDNDLRIDAQARAYDYTPRRPGGDEAQRDAAGGGRRNGGADAFLDLIGKQIVPKVEALAKTDPARRTLWGHSYGGVFALHALLRRPRAFAIHVPVDPSLWWGDAYLLQVARDARPDADAGLWLMAGEGANERQRTPPPGRDPAAVEAMRRARAAAPPGAARTLVADLRARGLRADYTALPGLSHGQTLGASLPIFLRRLAGLSPEP